ncbi:helix-turn-helix transcriptional regulator [Acidithiobacillus caldus ATCC 51756]|nr:helix-turn-helix transcriptional regulator [Acidithiobacillus caldus ATCC 51756]MBU2801743.1 helix-turn-helix transcriptional regulator [Acidithiobacillus caldus]
MPPNHPNRGRRENPARNPTPEEIRKVRLAAGLTQRQAAELIHSTTSAWESWEQGLRRMHPGLWELFLLKRG